MDKKSVGQYAGGAVLAVAVFAAGAISQGLFPETDLQKKIGILSDCFLLPGVLLGGMGALSWAASEGNFDMLRYGFHTVLHRFLHPLTPVEGFYEYKLKRDEARKGWLKHFLVIGLMCTGASIICLLLYLGMDS